MTGEFASRKKSLAAVWAIRPFRLLAISNFLSLCGIWIVRMCVAWLTWEMTHSKTWLGIMAFAELGPSVIVSLYAGILADRRDRVQILQFGQSMQVGLAAALVVLVLLGANSVWWMLVILLGFSVIGGLNLPARLSIAPMLVPPAQLATASAIGSMTFNITRLVGPMIAAPILARSLEWVALALGALSFAGSALSLRFARTTLPKGTAPAESQVDRTGYLDVLSAMLRDRVLALMMAMQFLVWLLVRPLTDMLPALADQTYRAGEYGFSALVFSVGIGALFGALLTINDAGHDRHRVLMLLGSVVAAVSMIVLAPVTSIWVALPILAVYGMAITVAGVVSTTLAQVRTGNQRLGRVMSIYSLVFRFAPAIGAVLIGSVADMLGLPIVLAVFPVLVLGSVALVWRPFLAAPMD